MKILKILGALLGALLAILLIVPAFLPGSVHFERSIEIAVPVDATYGYLSDFSRFKEWNPWLAYEPAAQTEVRGTGVGSEYEWKGEKTGHGKMRIATLEVGHRVVIEMDFYAPMAAKATANWRISPAGAGSKVIWDFGEELPYLMRYMGLVMDQMMAPAFESGLAKLKANLEAVAKPAGS